MKEKRTHIEISTPLMEMEAASDLASLVTVDPALIKEVTDGDDDPRYVISDIQECQSGNKINYDYDAFQLIAEQVNSKQPTGYLGHIKDNDRDTAFPEPQVLWLGASALKTSNGQGRLVTKGYLIPEGKARSLIKRKVINTVSWSGDAILVPAKEGGYRLKQYILESIDFSRKNREGLKSQKLVVVTEEMPDDKPGGKNKVGDEDKTYEEIVGRLTFAELKTLNPALLTVIREMTKEEIKEETTTAVKAKEDELTAKHEKELGEIPEISLMQKVKELLGIKDDVDPIASLSMLIEQLDDLSKKAVQSWFNDEILAKKVPNEKARKLVGRLIPVTEMKGDWRSDNGQEKIKKELEDKVDDLLDNDEEIQMVIREMGSSRGGVRLKEMDGGGHRERYATSDDDKDAANVERQSGGRLKLERTKVG